MKLKKQEVAAFKKLLQERRDVLAGDLNHLEEGALRKTKGDAATLDISNFADLGSDNFEQDFMIGLIENSEEVVQEIDAALQRIEDNAYGMCEDDCGHPIGKDRLKVIPWARLCIECQRKAEVPTKEE